MKTNRRHLPPFGRLWRLERFCSRPSLPPRPGSASALSGSMRKALLIFACVLGVLAIGAMLVRCPAGSTTTPDVRVAFLGLTNGAAGFQDARFQVVNRGPGRIRVLEISIEAGEPFQSVSLPGTILGKPVTLQPGAFREFRTPFLPVTSHWRGSVTVSSDTLMQRYRDWLLKQSWRTYLPRKWLPRRSGVYTFSSPWGDKSLNQRPALTRRPASVYNSEGSRAAPVSPHAANYASAASQIEVPGTIGR